MENDNIKLPQGDELTEKMHSEFQVDAETERRHRVFTLLTLTGTEDWNDIKVWAERWNIPMDDVKEFIEDYKLLRDGTT